jgi:ribonuclease III
MEQLRQLIARLFRRPARPAPVSGDDTHPLFTERLREFERRIDYRVREKDTFMRALRHRSYLQHKHYPGTSNERMEFLGDSILNLIVGEYLYHHYPRAEEGDLTKIRSRLVNRKALAAYAKAIGLADFILTSPSASSGPGKGQDTIAADTFEAVIAAIYLDGGFDAARQFVERRVLSALKSGTVVTADDNYKSMLLEYSQANGLGIPRYTIVLEEGPDHDRTFTVEVSLSDGRRGRGKGKNKKEAEQAAAARAIEHLA